MDVPSFVVSFLLPSLMHLLHFLSGQANGDQMSCPNFDCGELRNFSFPFINSSASECGLIWLDCSAEPRIVLDVEHPYDKDSSQTLALDPVLEHLYDKDSSLANLNPVPIPHWRLEKFLKRNICNIFTDFTFPNTHVPFTISPNIVTFFKCPHPLQFGDPSSGFDIYTYCGDRHIYYTYGPAPPECPQFQFPVKGDPNRPSTSEDPFKLVSYENFTLELHFSEHCPKYNQSGGQCSLDGHGVSLCATPKEVVAGRRTHLGLILGTGIATTGIVIIILLLCYLKRKMFLNYWKLKEGEEQIIEAFVMNFGSPIAPRRYHYSEVKKMTNNFKDKLGEGGFGSVYKGKLKNGQLVAIKVLKESKGNGEEFINEITSISRTSHVNIVGLLGFCYEGHKQALVYEFMPNGSLERFICNKNSLTECKLGGETLYKIAIGIARGLEYLHIGCKTRILHFDTKISDFGLSKLCLNRESNITILGPRGTIGYIAPEIFSKNFGRISYKSNVYSYGMMILEMTTLRENKNVDVSHTSEIYFPYWIYRRLELDEEIGSHGVTNEIENEKVRKMIIVGLWCIQTDPTNRPSMTKVIEMLEGSLEDLPIPPRPYLSSPPRELIDSSSTMEMM